MNFVSQDEVEGNIETDTFEAHMTENVKVVFAKKTPI